MAGAIDLTGLSLLELDQLLAACIEEAKRRAGNGESTFPFAVARKALEDVT